MVDKGRHGVDGILGGGPLQGCSTSHALTALRLCAILEQNLRRAKRSNNSKRSRAFLHACKRSSYAHVWLRHFEAHLNDVGMIVECCQVQGCCWTLGGVCICSGADKVIDYRLVPIHRGHVQGCQVLQEGS
eukprot:scaffold1789_cov375-Prasinococcus_capsulatus_cf.AAC.14